MVKQIIRTNIQDTKLIDRLVKIADESDWWDNISETERSSIERGVLRIWMRVGLWTIQKQENYMKNISKVIWSDEVIDYFRETTLCHLYTQTPNLSTLRKAFFCHKDTKSQDFTKAIDLIFNSL